MRHKFAQDATHDDLFLAGEKVCAGIYRQIGGEREVRLEREDVLPESLDGQMACYLRVNSDWSQMGRQESAQA